MRKIFVLGLVILVLLALAMTSRSSIAQVGRTVTIAVDLAHDESDKYLGFIQGNITSVVIDGVTYSINWVNITSGMSITSDLLSGVDILLIGQPTVSLGPDEMESIKTWLFTGNKVLYIAGDSDYGGGPASINAVNSLLEYIGSKLRLEHAAVYTPYPDTRSYIYKGVEYPTNAKAYYRVLAFVEPDPVSLLYTYMLDEGVTKPIIMHGPTCVIWVDETGKYRDPVEEVFPGLIRLVWFRRAYIGDNTPPSPFVYDLLSYGLGGPKGDSSFVGYAAEYFTQINSMVVVAGESLYGDYEPAWSSSYYGVDLDGPKFVTNLIRWWIKVITTPLVTPITTTITTTETKTVTTTTTTTETITTTMTTTTTTTITEKTTETTTITEKVPDYTSTIVVSIIAIIIIAVLAIRLRKK
jgi:hypothetical protein